MLSGWLLSALAVLYLGFLFAIAFYGDRHSIYPGRPRLRPYIYGLALGVYCTSWTFYGAVGTAARDGWGYLPIYVGPSLVYLLALPFLERLVEVGRAHKVGSIADFIASRFAKSRSLAALVAVISATAAIPYLALQYKAVAASLAALTTAAAAPAPWYRDTALAVALLMALFAVLFGARRVEATGHHEGLMLAIAFESLLKLTAFGAAGVYAWLEMRGQPFTLPPQLQSSDTMFNSGTLVCTVLAAAAIFCLPRQFQVSVIECAESNDLKRARWILPVYLALFSVFVVPVVMLATSGAHAIPADSDTLMLRLPLAYGAPWLAVLVFLGGLSSATAMVAVAGVALATMISNNIAVPLLWQRQLEAAADLSNRILWLRRAVIVGLALLAFGYYRSTSGAASLAAIGLSAFAAFAQFAPAVVAGLYWSGASRVGVFCGMLAGFLAWLYLLFLHHSSLGAFELAAPLALNVLIMTGISVLQGATLQDRHAASLFVSPRRPNKGLATITAKVGDLEAVAARIIGPAAARRALEEYVALSSNEPLKSSAAADPGLLQHVERVLTGSIGPASARVFVVQALKRKGLDVDEVVEILDETSQELRFSRQLLAATMENITQGICVVDAELRIVAWNRRYLEMFEYPSGFVFVGRPMADLIRWNAQRDDLDESDPEQYVATRLARLQACTAYAYQRQCKRGQVFSICGQPIAGGGFVTTYTDITEFKRAEQALLEAKQELEARVEQRTQELREALEAQRAAKLQAEAANLSKTRFVAAASHDLLQPLNAARLFASALESRAAEIPEVRELASRIDGSMRAAEELLKDLLDVARLDIGGMRPEITVFPIAELLHDLQHQYAPLALSRRLRLHVATCRDAVRSDRVLLRRILQNYVSNALRYAKRGGVLLGCRRRGEQLEICVYDTGPGIAAHERERLYLEFSRLDQGSPWGEKGLGLGLSICDRLARLLHHELTLRSRLGRGSVFGVRVPRVALARSRKPPAPPVPVADFSSLHGFRVLVVDNDRTILDAMEALLQRWGVQVVQAHSARSALRVLQTEPIDAVLADHHLDDESNGLELISRIREECGSHCPTALLTADHDTKLARAARAAGISVLHKPVRPAALRALLSAFKLRQARGSAA
jgi:PAS domain S-box-containing protein